MANKILQIYDEVVDLLEATLGTQYKRLPNPYAVDQNTYLHLNNGYGLAVGPGVDTQRYVGCLITWERVYSIILVRRMVTTQNNIGSRELIEKDLLDDLDSLRKAIYLNSTLGGLAIKSTVLDDQGVAFIDADRLKFISLEASLFVEYQEDPNT